MRVKLRMLYTYNNRIVPTSLINEEKLLNLKKGPELNPMWV